jgi:hypothetical protein
MILGEGNFPRLPVALIGVWSSPSEVPTQGSRQQRASLGGVCSDDVVPRLRESGAIRLLPGRAPEHGDELGSALVLHAEQHGKFLPQRHREKTFLDFLCVSVSLWWIGSDPFQLIRAMASGTFAPL